MTVPLNPEAAPPKRRPGRPKNPEARPERATVRFTKLEHLAVKRRAGNARVTVADYCRQAVLTGQVMPTLDPRVLPVLHELRTVSNYLSQLARQAQVDGVRSIAIKADALLDEIAKMLAG